MIPEQEALKTVSGLVSQAEQTEREVEAAEAELKEKKGLLRRLLDVDIPEAMAEVGLTQIKTETALVEVLPFVDARITKQHEQEAFAWLRENGHGDVIKREVKAAFRMGEDEIAEAVRLYLEEIGAASQDKASVHPGTLKKLVRECDEIGEPVPDEIFSVYRGQTTKIRAL